MLSWTATGRIRFGSLCLWRLLAPRFSFSLFKIPSQVHISDLAEGKRTSVVDILGLESVFPSKPFPMVESAA